MRTLKISLLIFILPITISAQWVQSNGPAAGEVSSLVVNGSNLFAGAEYGSVAVSANNGTTWTTVNIDMTNRNVKTLAFSGTNLFAGTNGDGIFLSTNYGASWDSVNNGLSGFYERIVNALIVNGAGIFIGTEGGVFLSTDNGTSWTAKNNGVDTWVLCLAISGNNLFAGTYGAGVYLSTNNGDNWTEVNQGLTDLDVNALTVSGTNLFAGTEGGAGIYLSTNNGATWNAANNGLTTNWVNTFAVSEQNLFAGTQFEGVFHSTNNGTNWVAVNNGIPNPYVRSLALNQMDLFAGGYGILHTTNNGIIWSEVSPGLTILSIWAMAYYDSNLFVGAYTAGMFTPWYSRVFISTNYGNDWRAGGVFTQNPVSSFAVINTHLFAGTIWDGVFLSTNNGESWSAVNNGLTDTYITSLAVIDTILFAGSGNLALGVFRSTNYGESWIAVNNGLTDTGISCLAVSGNDLFAGCGDGVFRSTDYGENWFAANNGLPLYPTWVALVTSGSNLFAGFDDAGVFRSTNNGINWSAVNNGLPLGALHALVAAGTNLFASILYQPQPPLGGRIFLTTNAGLNWIEVSTGLINTDIACFAASENYLFAGSKETNRTEGTGVWRRPLSEMITVIEDIEQMQNEFLLSQNYPNPFNPVTKIKYSIPQNVRREMGNVSLKIYDVLGREVTTLVNEEKPAGEYEVEFDGSAVTSGIYFYQLNAGQYSETKKMILLK